MVTGTTIVCVIRNIGALRVDNLYMTFASSRTHHTFRNTHYTDIPKARIGILSPYKLDRITQYTVYELNWFSYVINEAKTMSELHHRLHH